jgi:hypothetical protein
MTVAAFTAYSPSMDGSYFGDDFIIYFGVK